MQEETFGKTVHTRLREPISYLTENHKPLVLNTTNNSKTHIRMTKEIKTATLVSPTHSSKVRPTYTTKMAHTVRITTTTTENTNVLVLNTGYMRTTAGLLKLAQLLLGIATTALLATRYHQTAYLHESSTFLLLMAVAFLISTACLLLAIVVSWSTGSLIAKTLFVSNRDVEWEVSGRLNTHLKSRSHTGTHLPCGGSDSVGCGRHFAARHADQVPKLVSAEPAVQSVYGGSGECLDDLQKHFVSTTLALSRSGHRSGQCGPVPDQHGVGASLVPGHLGEAARFLRGTISDMDYLYDRLYSIHERFLLAT